MSAAVSVRFFEFVTTYGEPSGPGYYWRDERVTDWVGPFADPAAALDDAETLSAE